MRNIFKEKSYFLNKQELNIRNDLYNLSEKLYDTFDIMFTHDKEQRMYDVMDIIENIYGDEIRHDVNDLIIKSKNVRTTISYMKHMNSIVKTILELL